MRLRLEPAQGALGLELVEHGQGELGHVRAARRGVARAEAYTSKQIATELFISVKTVERHRQNILEKLGMNDRVELARYAIRRGPIQA